MLYRGDDRAVSALVGAVLLLGIFVVALSMYQLNVVPNENYEIEVNHNERVTGDMVDLRNAIGNAASDGNARGVSITLGTQYNTRTFTVNPTNPAGTIQTERADQNVTIEGEDLINLNLETRYLLYEPHYNEYTGAPTATLEHTLLYNEFRDGNVTVEDQLLFDSDGDALVVPIVDGDLSRTGSGTVSVDVQTLEGPKTMSTSENVTVTLPTKAPNRWSESLEEQTGADVIEEGPEHVTFEAEVDSVSIARIGVGDDFGGNVLEDIEDAPDDPVDVNRTFDLEWDGDEDVSMTEGENGSFDVHVTDADTSDPIEEAAIDFSVVGGDYVDIRKRSDETDESGYAEVDLEAEGPGDATIYASAGDSVARLSVTVKEDEEESDPPADAPDIDVFETKQAPGESSVGIRVDWEVTAGDADLEEVRIEIFDNDGLMVDNKTHDVEGQENAKENNVEFDGLVEGNEYEVVLTVTDLNGQSSSESQNQTAG